MAGGGNCAGIANGTVPPPTCEMQTSVITYSTLDDCGRAVTTTHQCPSGCVFASGHSVECEPDGLAAPFRTCALSSDCGSDHHCSDDKTLKLLDSPICEQGLCDWRSSVTETCNLGCFSGACRGGGGGSTSGSFPSATPATCNGRTITYYFDMHGGPGPGGPMSRTYDCHQACFTDAKGVGCDQAPGEPPFHTCMATADCPNPGSQCVSGDTTTAAVWMEPQCPDGSCVWKVTEMVPCASGTSCQVSSCQ